MVGWMVDVYGCRGQIGVFFVFIIIVGLEL